MPTQTFEVTDRQDQVIKVLVSSGRYKDANEVMRDALRLLEEREAQEAAKLEALREAVRVGMASIEEGRYKEFKNADELADYLEELSKRVLSAPAN
jgi:antitoxin ParD1/3/4